MILYKSRYRKEKKKGWHGLGNKVKSEKSFPMLINKGHNRKGCMGWGKGHGGGRHREGVHGEGECEDNWRMLSANILSQSLIILWWDHLCILHQVHGQTTHSL